MEISTAFRSKRKDRDKRSSFLYFREQEIVLFQCREGLPAVLVKTNIWGL